MFKKSNINSFHVNIILLLSLFTLSLEQQCVLGKNCPLNQGMCVGDFCKCLDGFYSLLDPNLLADQQIYCNYEQINVYIPLIMEIFLPSIGHFYTGKYWLGTLKLLLLITYISTSLILFGTCGVPRYVITIMQKLGISVRNFLPEGLLEEKKEEKAEDEKINEDGKNENNDDENNETLEKKNSLSTSVVPIKFLLRTKKEENDNNINRGKFTQIKQAHNKDGNDVFDPEIEESLLEKEESNEKEEENEDKNEKNQILEMIFNISTIFWIFWVLDLFLFKFKVYNDGNGVPFVE